MTQKKKKRQSRSSVHFVAQLSLADCARQMQKIAQNQNAWITLDSIRVQVEPMDDESYSYQIRMWKYLNLVAQMSGELNFKDSSKTLVTGEAEINLQHRLLLGFMAFFGLIVVFTTLRDSNIGALVFIGIGYLILWINWQRMQNWQNQLVDLVEQVLGNA